MALLHHHSDSGLEALNEKELQGAGLDEKAIVWPAHKGVKSAAPKEQLGWHHGFNNPVKDDLSGKGPFEGESPRKGMGTSIEGNKEGYHPTVNHPAFHIPEEGDLNPGNQPPTSWD